MAGPGRQIDMPRHKTTLRCTDCKRNRGRLKTRCFNCGIRGCKHELKVGRYGWLFCPKCFEQERYEDELMKARIELEIEHERTRMPKALSFPFIQPCIAADVPVNGRCSNGRTLISPHGHALCDQHLAVVQSGRELDIGGAKILMSLDSSVP